MIVSVEFNYGRGFASENVSAIKIGPMAMSPAEWLSLAQTSKRDHEAQRLDIAAQMLAAMLAAMLSNRSVFGATGVTTDIMIGGAMDAAERLLRESDKRGRS